ncbi:MAG: agmatinase family protein [bacterium]|nr:agmatinase family protein [bacterium]
MDTNFDPDGPAQPGALYGLPHTHDEAAVHVLPVPFEATTSYRRGTARGPEAILAASLQVDLYDLEFGKPYLAGIHLLDVPEGFAVLNEEACALAGPIHEAGGASRNCALQAKLERCNAIGAELNASIAARVEAILAKDKLPCVLGGDHSVPFGAIEACAARHPGLGVLHFDAHADLRDAYEGFTWSHASILFNVLERIPGVARLVQVGVRDVGEREVQRIDSDARVDTLFDRDWACNWARARTGEASPRALVREWIAKLPAEVYVTFDVDGLDPSLCPNTGTPVPGGLDWHAACLWLEELAASQKRVVGLDLVEVNPGPAGDPGGESWDAAVGARLLYKLIGAALRTRA